MTDTTEAPVTEAATPPAAKPPKSVKPARKPKPSAVSPHTGLDYSATLYLPQTEFPMRAGLPKKEPELLARWQSMDLYARLREQSAGREKYVLHDGPPYANGHLHIGHALNKVLKDIVNRSHQMRGLRCELRAGVGLSRPAHRVEDRGAVPRQGPRQGPGADQ